MNRKTETPGVSTAVEFSNTKVTGTPTAEEYWQYHIARMILIHVEWSNMYMLV